GTNIILVDASVGTDANIVLDANTTSAVGGYADGVLGATTDAGEVTLIEGWNWYAGSDAGAIGTDQYDFQTVVTHELGHALGLGHSTDTSSVMFAELDTGAARRTMTTADLDIASDGDPADGLHAALPAGDTAAITATVAGADTRDVSLIGSAGTAGRVDGRGNELPAGNTLSILVGVPSLMNAAPAAWAQPPSSFRSNDLAGPARSVSLPALAGLASPLGNGLSSSPAGLLRAAPVGFAGDALFEDGFGEDSLGGWDAIPVPAGLDASFDFATPGQNGDSRGVVGSPGAPLRHGQEQDSSSGADRFHQSSNDRGEETPTATADSSPTLWAALVDWDANVSSSMALLAQAPAAADLDLFFSSADLDLPADASSAD
ncbi:MAG: matrixin family metalloprotease, partial [Planctomycetes bacterium]|nr:matrixin family metalloprotease [Planctomycetota bacterium]